MIVVDASAMSAMLIYADERGQRARSAMARDTEWAAPVHWKVEVFSVIRGLALGRKITDGQAVRAVARLTQLGVDHVAIDGLLPRMWQLRATISGFDAAYVALAENRSLTLVTSDARLARAANPYCRIELIA
jgi:predicted nucleic acid-binding protein